MPDLRRHGDPPFVAAVLHGGPGASGDMAAVAAELAARGLSTLEPLPHGLTIGEQIEEIAGAIVAAGSYPLALIGHSWGAWAALLAAAAHPGLVERVILVGCPPLRASDADGLDDRRLARLAPGDRDEAAALLRRFETGDADGTVLARLGALMEIADAVEPLPPDPGLPATRCEPAVFRAIWAEAAALRRLGEIERTALALGCPIRVIHGDRDGHPAAAVETPLREGGADVAATLLADCGHVPWREARARRAFFDAVAAALGRPARGGGE